MPMPKVAPMVRRGAVLVVGYAIAFATSTVNAADIALTPPSGGGVAITNAAGSATRLRVGDDGTFTIPGIGASAAGAAGLCVEIATGKVGTCSIGTLTNLVAGTGLSGGTITTTGTLSIASSFQLPQSCSNGQMPASNGAGGWSCTSPSVSSGGTVTNVATGAGLTGGPITATGTVGLAATQLLPTTACATNQVPKWSGTAWACAADASGGSGTVTNVATGAGVTGGPIIATGTIGLATTQLLPTAACAANQFPEWSGSNWTCAANLTLASASSAGAGTIFKGANRFIHNFGTDNTFVGAGAGNFTMTGIDNTASGALALAANVGGIKNTAHGARALASNTDGFDNTAMGRYALFANTAGNYNTAAGSAALLSNSGGSNNVATGASALVNNATGNANTACGSAALVANIAGSENTAVGFRSLGNATGGSNTAIGSYSLYGLTSGANNIAVGYYSGNSYTTGNYNIAIGNQGNSGESATIRIGDVFQTRTFIAGIRNVTTAGSAIPVLIDINGQLGTFSSSRRYKDDIAEMGAESSGLMKLRPVTFHYRADPSPGARALHYGLIAEEVAEVYPGLVAHSADGQIETVMYQYLPPMLLNEYQKQQRTIEAQAARIASLEGDLAAIKQILGVR